MMQRCGFPSEPSLGAESDKVLWFVVLTICLVGCALVALLGRLHPDIVPDTASYFRVGALPDSLAQPRTPVYMWLTGPLYFNGFVALVPWLHLAAFVSATLLLAWQSKLSGLSRTGVVSICLAAMTWSHPGLACFYVAIVVAAWLAFVILVPRERRLAV